MKDNSLDGHRAKVALSDTALKCDLKSPAATDGNTNFDDDYNEWELGIGDLIIDLDADIEKTNERHQQNGTKPPLLPADSFGFLAQAGSSLSMSNSKSPRLASAASATATANSTNGGNAFEHQATVDKGLKMKIKRKTVGSKYSEAKHEIVQSDTNKAANSAAHPLAESTNSANNNTACSNSNSGSNSPAAVDTPKSKHSSSKGRNSGHREKKDKNRDKNASVRTTTPASGATPTCEVNGVMSPLKISNCGGSPPSLCSTSSPLPTSVASPVMVPSPVTNCTQDSSGPLVSQQATSSPPMPNLTLKLDNKFAPSPIPCSLPTIVIKQEERPASPPLKKIKVELPEVPDENDCPGTPGSIPEMKDTSTCTSVGTVIEPDCLGPCEPGTSVMLEGIVWQETEGGVLVVNVTWRGKTYVGTLLDCTKHDWAPPRFCESPTSDVDSKTAKGRGKRGRGGNTSAPEMNLTDTRNCVQSKLRNGKGRRTTINSNGTSSGFTVPNSPAKSENNTSSSKRKGRPNEGTETNNPPMDSKSTKRSRTQNRTLVPATPEIPQPSSPQLITCPEPNCSKRYKHPNGLKYHRAHAHSGSDSNKSEDPATEDSKDVTNSSDNEESMQESASTSPAPSFANSVPSSGAKTLLNNSETSSSSSANGLPESEPYTADLSTLASVAISDSSAEPKAASTSQDLTTVNTGVENLTPPSSHSSVSSINPVVPLSDMLPVSSAPVTVLSTAVTTSVIQSSSSMDSNSASSQSISVNIPTSHVIFSQGMLGSSSTTTCATSVVCNLSNPLSPSRNNLSSTVTTTFANISSIASTAISSPSSSLPMIDKCKIKQEKPDKYKPKSPLPAIRPIVPAPTPLTALSSGMPGMNLGNHCVVNPSLKPIQPKPTILGEPSTVNPSLESLKKDKSKHKKKSKDKERDKKLPLTPTKIGMGEECEALELTSYPSLDAAVSGPPHPSLSPLISQSKPSESSMDMSLPEDTMNENVQSPAYSDISDANDTAPILESEVPSGKEKEDKIGKSTPDTSQSPATNISAYGMYPYYSQPPYLLPSVSPQSATSGSQGQTIDKGDLSKKSEQERVKESRPWSNPSGESRDRQHMEQHHEIEKKQPREENVQVPTALQSGTPGGMPVQEYPLPQHYPSYPYGYVQGYPYPVEPSSYHMHMLESDPHYKQQYKQYLDEHHRMYKEQQHHQQLQQLQQQAHHHQQQQQQQAAHHSHHHSQHQSSHHHSSKSSHHSMKEDREKERSRSLDKGGLMAEQQHSSSKIQHSSSQMSSKDQDVREMDMRPPSLPAQARLDAATSSAASLKDKQTENHQILKENIELKSQMDESKSKANQYEMAMLFERHKEDMRRYYTYQDRIIEQQQQKMEPGIHHHTHHHQTIQSSHTHLQASYSSSLKSLKEDLTGSHHSSKSSSSHYGDSRSSPAKSSSDHIKSIHASTTSSPKGSRDITIKKEGGKSSGESSSDKKDKIKVEPKPEPEGQKPTMETTGPPPPPTNSYAYLHPSYLQPPPPHFAHMPFEPAMYRGGINPMLVSTPHYANPPYMHPQIRFVGPELHPSGPPAPAGPAKALDLLHQVSQQYTTTHKIHELSEHAVMSPTPTGTTPSAASTPSSSSGGGGKGGSSAPPPEAAASKEDSSRSPPTQRHLHTHHHTHVGVGYPLYDPYGVAAQKSYT